MPDLTKPERIDRRTATILARGRWNERQARIIAIAQINESDIDLSEAQIIEDAWWDAHDAHTDVRA